MKSIIYGYYFAIIVEKGEVGYLAYAPGVGGVYEEGETEDEAAENAYRTACAIFETRATHNEPIIENNQYLKLITTPPTPEIIEGFNDTMPGGYIIASPCVHLAQA